MIDRETPMNNIEKNYLPRIYEIIDQLSLEGKTNEIFYGLTGLHVSLLRRRGAGMTILNERFTNHPAIPSFDCRRYDVNIKWIRD